ncbi:hypothetical protein CLOM_g16264 [Closterium sp. NIES-68]|nr:hypothetical protein CLOM_g16264 [Closterium sp. NIES-68]
MQAAMDVAGATVSTVVKAVKAVAARFHAKDQVVWLGFDTLHMSRSSRRQVLLLAYTTGFHVWDLHAATPPHARASSGARGGGTSSSATVPSPSQLVSWRGELVSMLCAVPHPIIRPLPAHRDSTPMPSWQSETQGLDGQHGWPEDPEEGVGEDACDRWAAHRPLVCVAFPAATRAAPPTCACMQHADSSAQAVGAGERLEQEAESAGGTREDVGWRPGRCVWEYCGGVGERVSGDGGGSGLGHWGGEEGGESTGRDQQKAGRRQGQAEGQQEEWRGGTAGCDRCGGAARASTVSRAENTANGCGGGGGRTRVALYSLRRHDFVGSIEVDGPVVGVRASGRVIAVVQREQVFCYSNTALAPIFSFLTHPIPHALIPPSLAHHPTRLPNTPSTCSSSHPSLSSSTAEASSSSHPSTPSLLPVSPPAPLPLPLALGPRWLAYAAPHTPSAPPHSPTLLHSTVSLPRSPPSLAPSHPHITVQDVVSCQPIACFPALGSSPLAALQFDPSGVLLAAASIHGTSVGVWRIDGRQEGWKQRQWVGGSTSVEGGPVLLYWLQRGLTYSIPRAIAFSPDSSLLALLSAHGTSHLFRIDPFAPRHCPDVEEPGSHTPSPTSPFHLPPPLLSPASGTSSSHLSSPFVVPLPPATPPTPLPRSIHRPAHCPLSVLRPSSLCIEAPPAATLPPCMRVRGSMLSLWGPTVGSTGAAGAVGAVGVVGAALTAAVGGGAFRSAAAAISFAQWGGDEDHVCVAVSSERTGMGSMEGSGCGVSPQPCACSAAGEGDLPLCGRWIPPLHLEPGHFLRLEGYQASLPVQMIPGASEPRLWMVSYQGDLFCLAVNLCPESSSMCYLGGEESSACGKLIGHWDVCRRRSQGVATETLDTIPGGSGLMLPGFGSAIEDLEKDL